MYVRYFGVAKLAVLESEIVYRKIFPAYCKANTETIEGFFKE